MKKVLPAWIPVIVLFAGCFLYPRENQKLPWDSSLDVEISFSLPAGFYSGSQVVTLSCNDPGADLYYTFDGSLVAHKAFTLQPTHAPQVYNTAALAYKTPVTVNTTTVLRARAFRGDVPVSGEYASTYFINETTTLPVFSLVMSTVHLWDNNTGIYVTGPDNTLNPYIDPYGKQNYFQDWERPAYVEFFETDHSKALASGCGVKIFGGGSRGFPQKSLALFARAEYGTEPFYHAFFSITNDAGAPITGYYSLVLRNSGDDWYRTMFRDAFLQSLCVNLNIERQAYRPAVLFLNGQYWGIHNIREKINEDYLAAHYAGVDAGNVDILTFFDSRALEGDNSDFLQLLDFIRVNNMALADSYAHVTQAVDISNLVDYTVAQLFINNTDWPFTNIKFWRSKTPGSRWRWILYDTDSGFGLKDWNPALNDPTHNSLAYLLSYEADSHFRTLFINLIQNSSFRAAFLARFRALLAADFLPANVTTKLNAMEAVISPEIARHNTRWPDSALSWSTKVAVMRDFAAPRHTAWEPWLTAFENAWAQPVKNGTFDHNGLFWSAGWVDAEKSATFTFNGYAGGEAGGTVNTVDPSPAWSDIVMFFQDKIYLEAGNYELHFFVKASEGCQVGVALVEPESWTVYNECNADSYYVVPVTESYAEQIVNCTVGAAESTIRLVFVAGVIPAGTTVYVDNVSLVDAP